MDTRKTTTVALVAAIAAVVALNVIVGLWKAGRPAPSPYEAAPTTASATTGAATTGPATTEAALTAGSNAATAPATGKGTPATTLPATDGVEEWVPDAQAAQGPADVSAFVLPAQVTLPEGVTQADFAACVSNWLGANGCAAVSSGSVTSYWAAGDGSVMTWTCTVTDAASGARADFAVNWTPGNPLTVTMQ